MCGLRHGVEHRGLGGGRRHAVDEHAVFGELLAERFGQADQPGLRRAVVRRVGVALLAGDRRDVDDTSVAARDHVRHDRAAGQVRRDQVDLDHAAPDRRIELPGGAVAAGDAGVVDQDVDLPVALDRRLDRGIDRILLRQLDHRAGHVAAVGQLAARMLDAVGVDVPQHHRGAGVQHALRGGVAEALGAAGDHGHAVVQVDSVHPSLRRAVSRRLWTPRGAANEVSVGVMFSPVSCRAARGPSDRTRRSAAGSSRWPCGSTARRTR